MTAVAQATATATAVERPVLFSGPMVLGILAGRKTQTRRLVSAQEGFTNFAFDGIDVWSAHRPGGGRNVRCPYGRPGDRLWVRESFYCDDFRYPDGPVGEMRDLLEYRADHECRNWEAGCPCRDENGRSAWRPSIHMPRWASRLTLEVTDVRVQRLHEIAAEDAVAEGLRPVTKDGRTVKYGVPDRDGWPGGCDVGWKWHDWNVDPVKAYARLWDQVNGERGPWAANPWVWAVSFRRLP